MQRTKSLKVELRKFDVVVLYTMRGFGDLLRDGTCLPVLMDTFLRAPETRMGVDRKRQQQKLIENPKIRWSWIAVGFPFAKALRCR